MKLITTFATDAECRKAVAQLDRLGLPYELISPEPGYAKVGRPGLVMESEARMALAAAGPEEYLCAGWIEHRPPRTTVPTAPPATFREDLFGEAAIVVLVPCVADKSRIRFIAHLGGNLAPVFPYLNTLMPEASYNARADTFTFMDGHRLVALYAQRVVVAKADDVVDAWRTLDMIRCRAGDAWARRDSVVPSTEMRQRPPALEIFKRLPRTNCGACGQASCLAFAVMVHEGELCLSRCRPVFEGDFGHLRDALVEVCMGLGVSL
jgi:ArsR family metal-binding transcriptional regulator